MRLVSLCSCNMMKSVNFNNNWRFGNAPGKGGYTRVPIPKGVSRVRYSADSTCFFTYYGIPKAPLIFVQISNSKVYTILTTTIVLNLSGKGDSWWNSLQTLSRKEKHQKVSLWATVFEQLWQVIYTIHASTNLTADSLVHWQQNYSFFHSLLL